MLYTCTCWKSERREIDEGLSSTAGFGIHGGDGRFVGMVASAQPSKPAAPLYNTVKAKLLAGKKVFSFTQSTADPAGYCEKASTTTTRVRECSTVRSSSKH